MILCSPLNSQVRVAEVRTVEYSDSTNFLQLFRVSFVLIYFSLALFKSVVDSVVRALFRMTIQQCWNEKQTIYGNQIECFDLFFLCHNFVDHSPTIAIISRRFDDRLSRFTSQSPSCFPVLLSGLSISIISRCVEQVEHCAT